MKLDITEEKENPVMKRKEIKARIDFGGGATPSKAEMQVVVATERNVAPEQVEIVKVISDNGMPSGTVWIKIWEEKKVEIYAKPKEKPAEEKPAEAPKEEAPKEEPKAEEKPAETPKEEPKPETPKEEPKAEEKKGE